MKRFSKLFEPGKIGKLEIKNRIVMGSMALFYVEKDGNISDRQIAYYIERARGGVGLILSESSYPRTRPYPFRVEINDDRFIPGLSRLAKAVHNAGTKIVLQMNIGRGRLDEVECVSASDVPHPVTGLKPRALTIEEINKYIEEYREGARRGREAGFDGILVHANGGYLVDEFLSPFTNRRTDEYGGSIEKRAKFAVDLVKAIKAGAGSDFTVIFKLMTNEHIEQGLQLKDSIIICQLLEKAGVDAFEVVSGSVSWSVQWAWPPMGIPHYFNVVETMALKRNLSVPVIAEGRIVVPSEAENILLRGDADFVSLGRAFMCDPEWPNKALAGRTKEIRKCVGCLHCWDDLFVRRRGATCTVNPLLGEEKDFIITPAAKPKKVLVIGGGPAGMEAARIAALRGHKVTLWERGRKLGGQLNVAMKAPSKAELGTITETLTAQIKKLGVKIELGKEGTAESVLEFAPDTVIVATGARPTIPDVPGMDRSNVVTAVDVLANEAHVGKEVIILGGGMIGCELADFLSEKGRIVTILKESEKMAEDLTLNIRKMLLDRLQKANVRVVTKCALKEISEEGVKVVVEGSPLLFSADTVVLAKGMKSNNELGKVLEGKVSELYTIGDCVEPRRVFDAIYEGAHIAIKI